jgi:hypothetical protein
MVKDSMLSRANAQRCDRPMRVSSREGALSRRQRPRRSLRCRRRHAERVGPHRSQGAVTGCLRGPRRCAPRRPPKDVQGTLPCGMFRVRREGGSA